MFLSPTYFRRNILILFKCDKEGSLKHKIYFYKKLKNFEVFVKIQGILKKIIWSLFKIITQILKLNEIEKLESDIFFQFFYFTFKKYFVHSLQESYIE
jgi:hypothetical protein